MDDDAAEIYERMLNQFEVNRPMVPMQPYHGPAPKQLPTTIGGIAVVPATAVQLAEDRLYGQIKKVEAEAKADAAIADEINQGLANEVDTLRTLLSRLRVHSNGLLNLIHRQNHSGIRGTCTVAVCAEWRTLEKEIEAAE